jgi:glyceraldehyde 3-phosphate dehydrogenase
MAIKVGVNGFGRIGRNFYRCVKDDKDIEVVAVNDIGAAGTMAHLLKYDSVHGVMAGEIKANGEDSISVDGKEIKVLKHRDPAELPWGDLGVEYVVESTGIFRSKPEATKHLTAGAKKVIISAPAKDEDLTVVLGVNEEKYDSANHNILSNASCTTNCVAPLVKVLHEKWGVVKGLMTTIHSYTNDQQILDLPHSDLRRARAAGLSMIPTSTGAAAAVGLVLPELKGKLDGLSVRVPTPNVSVVDLVVELKENVSKEDLLSAYKAEEQSNQFFKVCEDPCVSIDFNGNKASSILDAGSMYVIDNMVKVLSWYDNEMGYSARLGDLIKYMESKK